MENAEVIVVGRNYCNILTTIRALGKAGYQPHIIRLVKDKPNRLNILNWLRPEKYSKYARSFQYIELFGDEKNFLSQIMQFADESKHKLLFPTDDYSVYIIDKNLDKLSKYFYTQNIGGKKGEILRMMSKSEQKEIAKKYGLDILESVVVRSEDGKYTLPTNVPYPCFVKSNINTGGAKKKMTRCVNEEELRSALSSFSVNGDFEVIVEEYAEIFAEYALLGVSTKQRTLIAGGFRTIAGGHKERKGVAMAGEIVHNGELQAIYDKCCNFICSLNYTGMFDIDFIELKNRKIIFTELNFREGASTQAFTEAGINMPGIMADYLSKGTLHDDNRIETFNNIFFVNEKVLIEELAHGDIDIRTARHYLQKANCFFIQDDNDIKPYQHFKKFYIFALILRPIYWFKSKKH